MGDHLSVRGGRRPQAASELHAERTGGSRAAPTRGKDGARALTTGRHSAQVARGAGVGTVAGGGAWSALWQAAETQTGQGASPPLGPPSDELTQRRRTPGAKAPSDALLACAATWSASNRTCSSTASAATKPGKLARRNRAISPCCATANVFASADSKDHFTPSALTKVNRRPVRQAPAPALRDELAALTHDRRDGSRGRAAAFELSGGIAKVGAHLDSQKRPGAPPALIAKRPATARPAEMNRRPPTPRH